MNTMQEAYDKASNDAKTLRETFTVNGTVPASGVDSNTFTPWVRLSTDLLDEYESHRQLTTTRSAVLEQAQWLVDHQMVGSFDVVFPGQKSVRIRKRK